MASKQTSSEGGSERSGSLKDQIIEQIRQEQERERRGDDRTTAPGVSVRAEPPKPSLKGPVFRKSFFGPDIRQMADYCRQLATLIDVGIPLLRSLQILGQRSANFVLRRVSQDLARRVEEGQPLSTAMMANQDVFSPMFIGVVRTGEAGGILENSMRHLAEILEKRAEIRRRVFGAMLYPAIALLVEIAVIIIIAVFALPKILSVYTDPNTLPWLTRTLLFASKWVNANWAPILIAVLVIILGVYLLLRTTVGHDLFERVWLRVPLFGSITRKVNVARFSRTLGSLTAAGIPLIDGLRISAETSDSGLVEKTLMRVHDTVERGGKMEEPMRQDPIFDPFVVDMIMVGDEAGTLDTMLLKIADTYDAEVDISLRTMTSILEPILILFLGVGVGILAIAVFQPYVNLVRNPRLVQ